MKKWYLGLLMVPLVMFGVSRAALAETQNVKVSGSIDAYSFYRSNFDLLDNNDASVVPVGGNVPLNGHGNAGNTFNTGVANVGGSNIQRSDADNFFFTITQVEVSADLTDNVSTVINLINQRDWNAESLAATDTSTAATNAAATNEFDILLDLAYVQMKEIFYSPLTLTIGRQDLSFGRGFIIGWNPQDPQGSIQADEFTQIQSFDAIRATLDFNPWTLDFVYSKIREGATNPEDDRDLYITYLTYKFAEYNAVADAYWTGDLDRNTLRTTGGAGPGSVNDSSGTRDTDTQTVGGRVQFDPISQITLGGELAYQFGHYRAAQAAGTIFNPNRNREAWATDLFGEYRWDNTWKPMLGVQYVYLSGEPDLGTGSTQSYGAWNGFFRGPVYGWIHDYLEVNYATASNSDQPAGQNQQHVSVYGSLLPMTDLKLTAAYWHFWAPESQHTTITNVNSATLSSDLGDEIDLAAMYSYTEDVTFTMMADWFIPGSSYNAPANDTATQLVGEVKVTF
jgi:hypothetical protein